MKCKACYRECGPAKYAPKLGIVVTPVYCDERHGGLARTVKDWSSCQEAQTVQAHKPKAQAVPVGQGLARFTNPFALTLEEREYRKKLAAEKRQRHEDKLAKIKAGKKGKKKKGDKKDKNKKAGKGGKGGKEDKKAGKGDKGARRAAAKAAQYGGGGGGGLLTAVSSSKVAPATTPATTPAKIPPTP